MNEQELKELGFKRLNKEHHKKRVKLMPGVNVWFNYRKDSQYKYQIAITKTRMYEVGIYIAATRSVVRICLDCNRRNNQKHRKEV